MNKIILSGNLTRDPEIFTSKNGRAIAKMTIAVNHFGEGADFFNLVAFDKRADFCQNYLHKGSSIIVDGKLQTNRYTDKDGNNRIGYDIVIDNIEFSGSRKKDADSAPSEDADFDEPPF